MEHQSHNSAAEGDVVIQHRNPLGRGFLIVSRSLLYGYSAVSDGAKLTYWVVYDHDWNVPELGGRKGYAYPSVARIARLRGTTTRTIQRHLAELIGARLLTREARPGQANVLFIEEPRELAIAPSLLPGPGGDKNVRGGMTKMSPLKQNKEKHKNTVNAFKTSGMGNPRKRTMNGLMAIGALLPAPHGRTPRTTPREWLAQEMLTAAGDPESLGCYRLLAERCSQSLIFEAISLLKDAHQSGQIRRSRGALLLGIVRRLSRKRGLPDPLPRPPSTERPRVQTVLTNTFRTQSTDEELG